tara:strand:+ start:2153 stop:2551 length:399 start_codon:yes stop_codon:yes gene_type:complete
MATTKKYGWFKEFAASADGSEMLAIVENTSKTEGGVTDDWSAISATGINIRLEYSSAPVITGLSYDLAANIEKRYIKGIVDKAIASGYKDPRNMNLEAASYFENEYEKTVKKAKKHAKGHLLPTGRIIPQDF